METPCELCGERAAVYCCADEAYVCWNCDSKVHGANFIVARHLRSVLCCRCQAPTLTLASGNSTQAADESKAVCPTCACPAKLELLSPNLSNSSAAVHSQHSSTTTDEDVFDEVSSVLPKTRKRRRSRSPSPISVIPASLNSTHTKCPRSADRLELKGTEDKLELILEGWNRQLGFRSSESVVSGAMQLLRRIAGSIKCNQLEKLDARSALAACLWMSLKLECSSSLRLVLPRVDKFEKCTGISAEVVLSVEAKLCQVCDKANMKRQVNLDLAL